MTVRIGETDSFEEAYTEKFRAIAVPHGQLIRHDRDRSVLDIGIQLTLDTEEGKIVTGTKVWFQLKGIQKSTLSTKQFDEQTSIALPLDVEHLRHWYNSQEAVYIVVYIESKQLFLAADIGRLVTDGRLNSLPTGQKTLTVHIPTNAVVNDAFWQRLLAHKSMRIDVGVYKGNPLPHNRDVRSDVLQRPEAPIFRSVVDTLLAEHGYEVTEEVVAASLFSNASEDAISVSIGKLYSAYEWIPRITVEFIPDEDGLRYEGQPQRAWGKCAVLIHSQVTRCLEASELRKFADYLQEKGIKQLLVFINHYFVDYPDFGSCPCFHVYNNFGCIPQQLEDISFKILTTANIYLNFRDNLLWMSDYVGEKFRSGEWRILSPDKYC